MTFDTIREACGAWVNKMTHVPMSVAYKLLQCNEDDLYEITPPALHDRVYVFDNEFNGYGEIVETNYNGEEDLYLIKLDGDDDPKIICRNEFEVQYEDCLPMWGTMFVPEMIDQQWITGEYCNSHLQEVADCGFRIFESEDYGLLLGIDGAGYDFFEEHWIPLYKARGLCWHREEMTA